MGVSIVPEVHLEKLAPMYICRSSYLSNGTKINHIRQKSTIYAIWDNNQTQLPYGTKIHYRVPIYTKIHHPFLSSF